MAGDISQLLERYTRESEVKRVLEEQKKNLESEINDIDVQIENHGKAQAILQKVAVATEQNLVFHIDNIVTLALRTVFGDELEFSTEFQSKRGKTECLLRFKTKDGELQNPITSHGGGANDIASFALRIAFWSLKKTNHVIILDEPMKFLSRNYVEKASEMIKLISQRLNIQIIMVTHESGFIDIADSVFVVKKENNISIVEKS